MANDNELFPRRRKPMPSVLLPVLALLLVLLSSITQQQAFAVQADGGAIAPLDHLLAASHKESFRSPSGNRENDTAADGDRDLPDYWRDDSSVSLAGPCGNACISGVLAGPSPSIARFLTPPLRAPPLA